MNKIQSGLITWMTSNNKTQCCLPACTVSNVIYDQLEMVHQKQLDTTLLFIIGFQFTFIYLYLVTSVDVVKLIHVRTNPQGNYDLSLTYWNHSHHCSC
jgi:hypothetical protein